MSSKQRAQKWTDLWFKLIAPVYDPSMRIGFDSGKRKELIDRLEAGGEKKGIEVGVGTGLNLKYHPIDSQIYCVDTNPKMMKKAEKRASKLGMENASFELGNGRELNYDDNSFDYAVLTYALSGIPDNKEVLSELERVVKPGGKIGIIDFDSSFGCSVLGHSKLKLHDLVNNRGGSTVIDYKRTHRFPTHRSMYILEVTK